MSNACRGHVPDAINVLNVFCSCMALWQSELCHMGEAVLAVEGACSM